MGEPTGAELAGSLLLFSKPAKPAKWPNQEMKMSNSTETKVETKAETLKVSAETKYTIQIRSGELVLGVEALRECHQTGKITLGVPFWSFEADIAVRRMAALAKTALRWLEGHGHFFGGGIAKEARAAECLEAMDEYLDELIERNGAPF